MRPTDIGPFPSDPPEIAPAAPETPEILVFENPDKMCTVIMRRGERRRTALEIGDAEMCLLREAMTNPHTFAALGMDAEKVMLVCHEAIFGTLQRQAETISELREEVARSIESSMSENWKQQGWGA